MEGSIQTRPRWIERRSCVRAVLLLLFGLLLSVLIAWGQALWRAADPPAPATGPVPAGPVVLGTPTSGGPAPGWSGYKDDAWVWNVAYSRERGGRIAMIRAMPQTISFVRSTARTPVWEAPVDGLARHGNSGWVPRWVVRGLRPSVAGRVDAFDRVIERYGWPLGMLQCESMTTLRPPVTETRSGSIEIPAKWAKGFSAAAHLPWRPVWGGAVVNSVVAAAAMWMALFGFGTVRRWRRRRRGWCLSCGYDLRHDVAGGCPECGRGRAAT